MKRVFIVLAAIFCFNNSYSQTNLDFEIWAPNALSTNDPTGWGTLNIDQIPFSGPASTFQETADPGEGASSARMVTTTGYAPITGGADTLAGLVSVGGSPFVGPLGIPYTNRPTSVDFMFKSNIAAGDTAAFVVQLSHWTGTQTIIDGQGVVIFTNPAVTSWTSFNIPITYTTADTPDTLIIVAASSQGTIFGSPLPIPGSELQLDSVVINLTSDVGVIAIDAPVSGCGLSAAESVTIRVKNFGSVSESLIPVSYSVNGGPAVNETITATIFSGDTLSFTFTATADLSTTGNYVFDAWTSLGGDADNSNDSTLNVTVTHISPITVFPYSEDFEGGTLGDFSNSGVVGTLVWSNTTIRGGDPGHSATRSAYFGNPADTSYNTGFIESASLTLPCIDLTALTSTRLNFNYFLETEQFPGWDSASVSISTDGVTFTDVADNQGAGFNNLIDASGTWQNLDLDLSAYDGNPLVYVRFTFNTVDNGFNTFEGFYVDDVNIYVPGVNDVGVIAVTTPASHCVDGSTDTITIQVVNFGAAPETSVPVSYTINGGPAVNETITTTINPGDTVSYTFTAGAVLSPAGSYTIDSWTSLPGDLITANDTSSLTITIFPIPTINLGADIALCPGSTATLNTSNFGFVSYSWNTGATDSSITTTIAGTFNLTVTDGNGCSNSDTIVVTANPAMGLAMSSTTATCGGSNGTASVVVTGGTGPFFYVWSDPSSQTNTTAVALSAGTYTVIVTDGLGCTDSNNVAVGNTTAPTVTITSSIDLLCNGDNNGQATVGATGGTTPYTYSWDDPGTQTNATATGLAAGTYVGTVTDNVGCAASDIVIITEPLALSLTPSSTNSNCGASDGSASVAVTGGTGTYTYLWNDVGTQTTSTAVTLPAGTYNVTVTDGNACTDTTNATVSDLAGGTASIGSSTNASCNGVCDGSATASITGGTAPFTYSWDDPASQTNITATGLCATAVNVTITDNVGCISIAGVTLTEPAAISLITGSVDATCGNSDGSASVLASGGSGGPYTYLWNDPLVQTTDTATALAAGAYVVVVTDAGACSDSSTVTVNNTGAPTVTVTSSTNLLCNGDSDGQATVGATGGTTPYTYSWDDPGTQTNATATGLVAGTYVGTVTDNVGCAASDIVIITEPLALSLTPSSTNSNCGSSDGSATVTVTGGTGSYTYIWDDPGTQTNATAGSIPAGTYNVTVTDGNACTGTASATVSDVGGGTASIGSSANASCNGICDGAATASITGGTAPFTYLWDDPASQTNITATGLCATAVNVTITDNVGCVSIAGVTLTEPSAIGLTTGSVDATCGNSDGSASVIATGGNGAPYTYLWNDPLAQTTDTATTLAAGAYVVVVTDAGACSDSATVTVNNTGAPTVTLSSSSNVSCNGGNNGTATVSATGGTTPYTYTWDDPGTQTSAMATGLSAGTYVGTVTDNVGCIASAIAIITEPAILAISFASTDVSCPGACDGNATATASGGTFPYNYVWTPFDPTSTACAGTYTVNIIDNNSCTANDSVVINTGAGLTLATSSVDATCGSSDGTATVVASGGTSPYTYMWNDPGTQTNAIAVGLAAGTYTVIVTGAGGCSDSTSVGVNNAGAPAVSISASNNVTCNGGTDGDATVLATGGTTPYTYLWDDGMAQTVLTAVNLSAGTYNVSVTDSVGCLGTASVTITEPTAITITSSSIDPSCFGSCDGSATATSVGGTGAHTYSWDDPGTQTTAMAVGLCDGTYIVTIMDSSSCTATSSITLTQPAGMTLTLSKVDATCGGCTDGTASVSVSGGTSPYTFLWDDPSTQTNTTATGLGAATYNVVVTDAAGCVSNGSVVVNDPTTVFTVVITTTNVTCVDLCDGSATAVATAGSTPYTYLWDDPGAQTTSTATGLCKGIYNVTVSDFTGTSITNTFTIFQPSNIVITPTIVQATCGNADGSIKIIVTGGTPPYGYLWSSGGTSTMETGLIAGTYVVIVTDNQACTQSASYDVGTSNGPVITLAGTNVTCNGANDGTAMATVTGGTSPYTYTWDDPLAQTSATAVGLSPGNYTVNVADATGCSNVSGQATVTEPTAMSVTTTAVDAVTGACIGTATATVIGGVQPYSYLWNDTNAQTNQTASGLCPGTYSVVVTDANGCTFSDSTFVGPVTGIEEYMNNTVLTIYPNPTSDIINIRFVGFSDEWNFELFDFTGKLVYRKNNISNEHFILNSEELPSGIYLLKAGDNALTKTVRIAIER